MEKVEYKKIKNSLILLRLEEIINKKRALIGSKKTRRAKMPSLSIVIKNQE